MKRRSLIALQLDVIFAIFIREIHRKFSDYKLGTLWAILDPMVMVMVFVILFGFKGRGEFGYVEPPLFILAAFLPFKVMWNQTMKECSNANNIARGLKSFRQIRLFDILVTRAIVVFLTALTVGVVISFGFWWVLGIDPIPYRILETIFYGGTLTIFGFAIGTMVCMVTDIAKEIGKLINITTMPLLFISAVFFPMSAIPEPYRGWLAYNPLVHPMELIRENWFYRYESPVSDPVYWGYWLIGALFMALMTYRIRWRKVMAL